jgi:hypothetical protein
MRKIKKAVFLLAMPFLFQGCVGYDRALFVTKTNVGIDIDTAPPTADINFGRKEIVIEPTFANGETPPVLGSFAMDSKGMFAKVSSTFSGGDAAVTMATLYSDETVRTTDANYAALQSDFDSTIKLNEKPDSIKLNLTGSKRKFVELNTADNTKPFYFATDTSLGLKASWNGTAGAMPSAFKLGYNRKEFALAPVFGQTNVSDGKYDVKMPSFLATIDTQAGASTITNTGLGIVQYFATGKAADRMALRQPVRLAMAKRLDPAAAAEAEKLKQDVKALADGIKSDVDKVVDFVDVGGNVDGTKLTKLIPNTGLPPTWVDAYKGKPIANLKTDLEGQFNTNVAGLAKNIP